jgi:hypothetical protein
VQRIRDGQAQVRYSVVGRLECLVTSCAVCTMHKQTRSAGFLVKPQNQCRRVSQFGPQNRQLRFGLVIWAPKLPRQFLGFDLKIKRATVCQLRHKTNGRRTARDTCRDLATCFTWKQVGLGFSNFASKLVEERWWVVHVASSRRSRGSKAKRWSVRWHRV